jgi:hypothetical protein
MLNSAMARCSKWDAVPKTMVRKEALKSGM